MDNPFEHYNLIDDEPLYKNSITIQTHNGKFHTDDVAAIALLSSFYTHKNVNVKLLRSRNKESFKTSDILVDVGEEYDPSNHRYDHHQKGCNETWDADTTIPLSSVGMVWKSFGTKMLEMYLNIKYEDFSHEDETWLEDVIVLWNTIYKKLILELDANDNGIPMITSKSKIHYNYYSNLTFPCIISSLNGTDHRNDEQQMLKFKEAVLLCGNVFDIKISQVISSYFSHKKDVDKTVSLMSIQSNKHEYLSVNESIPTIYKCLNKLDPDYRIKFLIFKEPSLEEYSIKTRCRKGQMFKSIIKICPLNYMVENLNNTDDIIFVHNALFIAKTNSLETALDIVTLSLQYHKINQKLNQPTFLNRFTYVLKPSYKMKVISGGLVLGFLGVSGLYYSNLE